MRKLLIALALTLLLGSTVLGSGDLLVRLVELTDREAQLLTVLGEQHPILVDMDLPLGEGEYQTLSWETWVEVYQDGNLLPLKVRQSIGSLGNITPPEGYYPLRILLTHNLPSPLLPIDSLDSVRLLGVSGFSLRMFEVNRYRTGEDPQAVDGYLAGDLTSYPHTPGEPFTLAIWAYHTFGRYNFFQVYPLGLHYHEFLDPKELSQEHPLVYVLKMRIRVLS